MNRGHTVFLAVMLGAVLGVAGCASKANDQQIAQSVQGKIYADSNVTSRQITAAAANGVVTLNGVVASDAERQSAANDAAQVDGVKTVVNNLTVAAAAAPAPAETPAPAAAPAPAPRTRRRAGRTARSSEPSASAPAPSSAPPATAAPPAPVAPASVTIPAGAEIAIRMIDSIDSNRNKPGDVFHASLDSPIVVQGQVVAPKGADVLGEVVAAKTSGKFTGSTSIALALTGLSVAGQSYDISTDQYSAQSSSRGKRTAETVGGGAAIGAIIGAIAGHGKGAAIGAAAGAGTGAAVQGLTKPQQVKVPSETRVVFHLAAPIRVIPPG
ncbi:MAG TPA: BON domain-containing protein [Candidatus Acidoferrales bacterium]|nr:BON domain-containing protein [Candidatus Acidoferrales bacterium]